MITHIILPVLFNFVNVMIILSSYDYFIFILLAICRYLEMLTIIDYSMFPKYLSSDFTN